MERSVENWMPGSTFHEGKSQQERFHCGLVFQRGTHGQV